MVSMRIQNCKQNTISVILRLVKNRNKIIIAAFIVCSIVGFVILFKPATLPSDETLSITRIKVEGMTCKNCEKSVKKALKKFNGIHVIEIDHATGKGYIKFDDKKVLEKDILIQINQTGFIATKRKPVKLQVMDYDVQFQTN